MFAYMGKLTRAKPLARRQPASFIRKQSGLVALLLLNLAISSCRSTSSSNQAIAFTETLPTRSTEPTKTAPPSTPTSSAAESTATLSPIAPIQEEDHSFGNVDADITLLVYSDFQCPYCASFYQAWKQIEAQHPNDLRLVFRHFPLLALHDKADIAGAAAEIAAKKDLFWEMHDLLFERQEEWKSQTREQFVVWLAEQASSIGLASDQFLEDLQSGEELNAMVRSYEQGIRAGLPGTPFIFFNSEWYRLNPNAVNLEASIRLELLKHRQYSAPPELDLGQDTLYFAHLELDQGEIILQLFPDLAPASVASFIFLAQSGWYDNIGFHRVESGSLVESGDPTATGLGGPGYLLLDELSDTLSFNEIGMVAMSSSGPNTNGSRFFINLTPLPHLNGARTIFGRIIEGLEILTELEQRDPLEDLFRPYDFTIRRIRIEAR